MIYKDERIKKTFDMVDFWDKFDTIKDSVETIDRLNDTDAYASFKRLWTLVDDLYYDIDKAERKLTSQNESYRRTNSRKRINESNSRIEDYLTDNGYRKVYDRVYKLDDGSKGDLSLIVRKLKELGFETIDYVEYTDDVTNVDYDLYKFKLAVITVYVGYEYGSGDIVVAFKPTSIFIDADMAD